MEVFDFFGKVNIPSGTALCLGNFDGVHLGHRQLFNAAKAFGKWGVLVFDGDFKGEKLITTLTEKLAIIEGLGADYVVVATPSPEFFSMSAENFYLELKDRFKVGMLSVGYDYRFGKGASGDTEFLRNLCEKDAIVLHVESEFDIDRAPVKSTRIRQLIKDGDMTSANALLGYNFFLLGKVEKGLKNGTKMGFPTANIGYDDHKLLPSDGVYKGRIEVDGEIHKACINIGKNPTFSAEIRTVEVHIPGFDADIYGKDVRVEFLEKIREEIKFDSVDQLMKQIETDVAKALED